MTDELKIFKKNKGKSLPIAITPDIQRSIKSFKLRLQEMCDNQEVNNSYQRIIQYLLNELDEYDLNILIAFYDQADCSPSKLSKLLGVDPSNVTKRIRNIITKCKSLT